MSGKAKLQAGAHGPAVIEGPATALSWLTVLPVRGGARAFDRITGARVIANLPVVGLVVGGVAAGVRWGLDALGTNGRWGAGGDRLPVGDPVYAYGWVG